MSTMPPNTPPGGGPQQPPYGSYDPKTQWRIYREQQKAAWRAQRDAWKAQRYAWRASYPAAIVPRSPSVVGPVILIAVGVIALLLMTGKLGVTGFWNWYAHWWPILLIGAGLALLGEWFLDVRQKTPVHRGGGFMGILLLLVMLGLVAGGFQQINRWRSDLGSQNDNFFNMFGQPEHEMDQSVLSSAVPSGATISIDNPHGDVSVTATDSSEVKVTTHEVAFSASDADARKVFDSEAAHLQVNGSAVQVRSEENSNGRVNMSIEVPKTARVNINAGHGDLKAFGLGQGFSFTAPHGDVQISSIEGTVLAHLAKGSFSAHDLKGDLTTDGPCKDMTVSEVSGKVEMNCDYFGEMNIQHVSGSVHFHTSKSDVSLASLAVGDLSLDDSNLRITEPKGAVHVVGLGAYTSIAGDGGISVEMAGSYSLDARNLSGKGDVTATVPTGTQIAAEAKTHNGDIDNDFSFQVNGDESKTMTGRVGSGAVHLNLSTDVGDVRLHKGAAAHAAAIPATPQPPTVGPAQAPKHLTPPKKPMPPPSAN